MRHGLRARAPFPSRRLSAQPGHEVWPALRAPSAMRSTTGTVRSTIRPRLAAALPGMTESTDGNWRDGYTLMKPEGLLAHYTTAPTVFMDILPGHPGALRLGPYRKMRDPAEHKDIEP